MFLQNMNTDVRQSQLHFTLIGCIKALMNNPVWTQLSSHSHTSLSPLHNCHLIHTLLSHPFQPQPLHHFPPTFFLFVFPLLPPFLSFRRCLSLSCLSNDPLPCVAACESAAMYVAMCIVGMCVGWSSTCVGTSHRNPSHSTESPNTQHQN